MTRLPAGSTATAPRGRVTVAEAAEISGLSEAEVYRRCNAGLIKSAIRRDNGTWDIQRAEAERLTRRDLSDDKRKAMSQIRVPREQYETWECEAKRRGCTVREFAVRLLDEASGWVDPVQRLSRAEILRRADAIARDLLHTTRDDAFARLERGELAGMLVEPELRMLRDMLVRTQTPER